MKKAIISGLIPLAIFSSDIQAGGTILSHFEERNVLMPKNLRNQVKVSNSASTAATAYPASGFTNKNIVVSGEVSYFILNDTGKPQSYWVDKWMCVDGTYCTHIRDVVSLGVNVSTEGRQTLSTNVMFSKTGVHEDEAIIQISGASESYSIDKNNVQVSP